MVPISPMDFENEDFDYHSIDYYHQNVKWLCDQLEFEDL